MILTKVWIDSLPVRVWKIRGRVGCAISWRKQDGWICGECGNPSVQQYSCFSSSHSTLSWIYMALGKGEALQNVKNIQYLPRGVLDHSPMVISQSIGGKRAQGTWKISLFWFELMKNTDKILSELKEFVEFNKGTVSTGVL